MTIGTRLATFFTGRLVGTDPFGNRYYTTRRAKPDLRPRRWVMYKGMPEPTKVPPMWNAWLRHMVNDIPSEASRPHHAWEQEHVPNLSGTAGAYLPPGHITRGADRAGTVGDYQAWTPGD